MQLAHGFQFSNPQDTQGSPGYRPHLDWARADPLNDATWLAWSEWTTCSDACGSCGVHMRTRTCLTTTTECVCPGHFLWRIREKIASTFEQQR
ncbi:hypothetical protein NECAME_06775 [Necator americanus]|uniref:Thrombospondin type 1 domain protein n=1 Tax=Necator americanus TaxID=51031 RepID=W2TUA8_NECAM|nr:hypothetical protein NECAME_06775 [Necator americanus]ETN84676.1 hypothetical protein NECAME_06775 [Necator americanus]